MNQRIRRLTVALIALFGILFVQLSSWQFLNKKELDNKPGNMHALYSQFDKPRGTIVTADGKVVADTVKLPADSNSKFDYQREYPYGDLYANITGYYSWGYGRTQLERVQNDVLAGKTTQQQLEATGDLFSAGDVTGSVNLTIDSRIQAAAKKALGNKEGSVVVVNPATGAVLAMYSNPSFDPNLLVNHDSNIASDAANALQNDPRKPLLANAYQERYMPGSTMKVVTTTIGFETGFLTLDRIFKNSRAWTPPNTTKPIRNYGKKVCGGDMAEVFRRSCNIPFAQTAVEVGPDLMVNGVNRFGFDERVRSSRSRCQHLWWFSKRLRRFARTPRYSRLWSRPSAGHTTSYGAHRQQRCQRWSHDDAICGARNSHTLWCAYQDDNTATLENHDGSFHRSNAHTTHDWRCHQRHRILLHCVKERNLRRREDGNSAVEP